MVVHAYFPLAEPRVQREARAASEAGMDVTVLALRGEGEARREQIDRVSVHRLPVRHVRGAGLARVAYEYLTFTVLATCWLAVRRGRRRFAIVHVHNPPDFLIAAGMLPRLFGAKLVLDIHDLSSHIFATRVEGSAGRLIGRLLRWTERVACRVSDAVITVHRAYRDELARRGIAPAKVSIVMNSVDEAVLEQARISASAAPAAGEFRIAYHGTITWWYGTDLIVDALALLRRDGIDADAVILGAGDAAAEVGERVRATGLDSQVLLSGRYLPIEIALATISDAACGVIPNRPSTINRFALSSKLLEYVALGIPVVVARLETLAAHFDEHEVTFFEAGDAESLAAALRWVHDHPPQAAQKAARARQRAEAYSWSTGRERLLGVYRELLSDEGWRPSVSAARHD